MGDEDIYAARVEGRFPTLERCWMCGTESNDTEPADGTKFQCRDRRACASRARVFVDLPPSKPPMTDYEFRRMAYVEGHKRRTDDRDEAFGRALVSLGWPFSATVKPTLHAEAVADVYRFLAGQFDAMDTGDLAALVGGDRTNPVDVLRGVREALRLYGIIPLRKAAAIRTPTPPPS